LSEKALQYAVEAAWGYQGLTFPNPAVGAAVTDRNGSIVSVEAHRKAGGPHAEVLALQTAYAVLSGDKRIFLHETSEQIHDFLRRHHGGIFTECTIHVTLEPCAHRGKTPSCAVLLKDVGIGKVVYAAKDPNAAASGGALILRDAGVEVEYHPSNAADKLLYPFSRWLKKGRIVTFKWAQRLDGTIDGGIVSSEASRRYVHAMRDAADLLVIGGNTVRTDRPTLDARLVDGKAPDVLILSNRNDFDPTIPLFGVAGRTVEISPRLTLSQRHRNVLVEGGPGLFETLEGQCDLFLCFVAPASGGTIRLLNGKNEFELLHLRRSGVDAMQWMK